ncbi:zinc-ribbon and DUF3426 domain-containing protein [Castellaniella sp.]|uniref:zinc-ribbon and DUF3426 domain-containing protein n=1 Tax=Castellaniella sp. TaxID=1955812 RepID=UPI0035633D6A
MKLTTRCPRCQTVFQASLADLQLRKGYVRCIQCAHIFDGYAEVTTDESPGPVAGPAKVPAAEPPVAGPVIRDEPMFVDHREPSLSIEPDTDVDEDDVPHVFRSAREPSMPARPEAFIVEARTGRAGRGGTASALLASHRRHEAGGNPWRLLGHVLLVVLLGLLLAQAVYVWRAQLAQAAPVIRPWLERACGPLRCDVPYARNLTRAAIMSSSLKMIERTAESKAAPQGEAAPSGSQAAGATAEGPAGAAAGDRREYLLSVVLRNGTNRPQSWPMLVLSLNDNAGALVVRRNLEPDEYLPASLRHAPFAAHDEVHIELPLALENVQANGFQLDLFYP